MELFNLRKIGLTNGEIKIYEALLELGETTRTQLAKKSGISPSKIYDVANRLLEKGIISSVKKNGVIHFNATNPERIKDFIIKKEEDLKCEKEIVNKLMPTLLLKYQKIEDMADIEVLYGWEGMRTVFYDIAKTLDKKDENYVFGASKGKQPEQMNILLSKYFKRVDKKGYKIKIIYNENVRGYTDRIGYFLKSKIHEIRYLHQDTFAELNIYKDTVLFMMLLKKPITIRIHNKEAAESCKQFFHTMWDMANR